MDGRTPTLDYVFSWAVLRRSRFDSSSGAGPNNADDELDSPTAASIIESQLVRREGSMHLPRPADCNVQGTHSDMCIVRVRRNHLLEDALDEIARQYRCAGLEFQSCVVQIRTLYLTEPLVRLFHAHQHKLHVSWLSAARGSPWEGRAARDTFTAER
jgi:hypothetical protein